MHIRCIVKHIVDGRRIEGGTFEFYHIVLPTHQRSQTERVAPTLTTLGDLGTHIACAETEQRHAFHTQRCDHDFTNFAVADRLVVLSYNLYNDKFGMTMPPFPVFAFAESSSHLSAAISGEELDIPFLLDLTAQKIE